jgi:hypothetical protein
LAAGKDIVVPNVVMSHGGRSYDLNSWRAADGEGVGDDASVAAVRAYHDRIHAAETAAGRPGSLHLEGYGESQGHRYLHHLRAAKSTSADSGGSSLETQAGGGNVGALGASRQPAKGRNRGDASTAERKGVRGGASPQEDVAAPGDKAASAMQPAETPPAEQPSAPQELVLAAPKPAQPTTRPHAVRLDAVGGAMLLVNAELHRHGLVFPPFVYRHRIETEGLSMMALDMGVLSWGLPELEVIHH